MMCLTILHKCSSSCLLSDFSRLSISWSDGSISGDPASKRRSNVRLCPQSMPGTATCGFWTSGFRHYEEALIFSHSQHFDARVHDLSHRGFPRRSQMNYLLQHCEQKNQIYFPFSMTDLLIQGTDLWPHSPLIVISIRWGFLATM